MFVTGLPRGGVIFGAPSSGPRPGHKRGPRRDPEIDYFSVEPGGTLVRKKIREKIQKFFFALFC